MKILIPKGYVDPHTIVTKGAPLIFLAGPVRGGGEWQVTMAQILKAKMRAVVVAIPSRWDSKTHKLRNYFLEPEDDGHFPRQLAWEQFYLKQAGYKAEYGCVLFWLPPESKIEPHHGPEPYAMDTRRELGKWGALMKYEHARVVVGSPTPINEPPKKDQFHGLSQIKRDWEYELDKEVSFHQTMEETAEAALVLASTRR